MGEPRDGHPEGSIRAHIAELERNANVLDAHLSECDRWRLRLLIHSHDTFKPEAADVKIADPRSHASLARAFLAEFCPNEAGLLDIVQFHDEPYGALAAGTARAAETISAWTRFLRRFGTGTCFWRF